MPAPQQGPLPGPYFSRTVTLRKPVIPVYQRLSEDGVISLLPRRKLKGFDS